MKASDFEVECRNKMCGWLWDEAINSDWAVTISLQVRELRSISNILRKAEGRPAMWPQGWSEANERRHTCE